MKRVVGAVFAVAAIVGLSGCNEILGAAVLTIQNNSENANILEVRVKGPGQADFGGNILTNGQLAPGNSRNFEFDAPQEFEDEIGITYQVQVTYEVLDVFDLTNVGIFNCIQAGDEYTWNWTPGSTPEVCVD